MESPPVYSPEAKEEPTGLTRVDRALASPSVDRSLWGSIAGALTWTRVATAAGRDLAESHCSSTWRTFLAENGFEPFGGVAETFPFLPFTGRRSLFYRSEDGVIVAAVTRSGFRTTLSFWTVFSDGLIITMSSSDGQHGLRRVELESESFIRYPMSEDPHDGYLYFHDAVRYFKAEGRTAVAFDDERSLVALGREYWRRRPSLIDRGRALGVPGAAIMSFTLIALLIL